MQVVKSTGEKEFFDSNKLCDSIKRSGAPNDVAENICRAVEKKLTPDVTTSTIFRDAMGYLVAQDIKASARYSLRRGVNQLGPAGFLFEQFVETILQANGYETTRNVYKKGQCVEHEVDVMAKKDGDICLVEAKYHNDIGVKTHIDKVMYANARLEDIKKGDGSDAPDKYHIWMVTNTKFTQKAVDYGRCAGMKLVGWNYPAEGSLEDMITEKKLYPLTVLPSITHFERENFFERGMILVQDLVPYSVDNLVEDFGIKTEIAERIMEEVSRLVA